MTTYHFAQNEQEVKQMNIRFEPVPRNEFGDFKKDVKEIFAIGVIEHFGMPDDGEPVPDRDVEDEAIRENQRYSFPCTISMEGEK